MIFFSHYICLALRAHNMAMLGNLIGHFLTWIFISSRGSSSLQLGVFYSPVSGCGVVKHYPNKRLLATVTTVLRTTNVTSEEQCVVSCYYDNPECLAINVVRSDDDIICEMTTGLSKESDMVDDSTSDVYVASR